MAFTFSVWSPKNCTRVLKNPVTQQRLSEHPPHAHTCRDGRLLPLSLLSLGLDQGSGAGAQLAQGPPWPGLRHRPRARPERTPLSGLRSPEPRSGGGGAQLDTSTTRMRIIIKTWGSMSTLARMWRHSPGRGLRDRRPVPPLLAAEGRRSVPVLRDADDALLLGHDHGHIHHLLGPLDPLQQDGFAGQRLGLDLRRHRRRGRAGRRRQARCGAGLRRPLRHGHTLRQGLWLAGAGRRGPAIIAWPRSGNDSALPASGTETATTRAASRRHHRRRGRRAGGAEPLGGGA